MLAIRCDQENAVAPQHAAARSKEAALQTPARKTNKSIARRGQDENAADRTKQLDGKSKQSSSLAFVTPVAPRLERAPLGAKTTNAKAAAFKTPFQPVTHERTLLSSTKRSRRAQFKVHSGSALKSAEERDVEYMPPRGEPLPDLPDPDIWPHDRTYSQLEGDNFTRGWAAGLAALDENSDYEEQYRRAEEKELDIKRQELQKLDAANTRDHGFTAVTRTRPKGSFASATSSSLARAKERVNAKKHIGLAGDGSQRHGLAKPTLSRVQRSEPTGRAVTTPVISTTSPSLPSHAAPQSTYPRIGQYTAYEADYMDEQRSMAVDILDIEGFEDFQLEFPE